MTHFLLFASNFIHVALRAFQQRNVAHLRYAPVLPLSLCIVCAEMYVIVVAVSMGVSGELFWHHILAIALGGGLGCMLSMYLHDRIF